MVWHRMLNVLCYLLKQNISVKSYKQYIFVLWSCYLFFHLLLVVLLLLRSNSLRFTCEEMQTIIYKSFEVASGSCWFPFSFKNVGPYGAESRWETACIPNDFIELVLFLGLNVFLVIIIIIMIETYIAHFSW